MQVASREASSRDLRRALSVVGGPPTPFAVRRPVALFRGHPLASEHVKPMRWATDSNATSRFRASSRRQHPIRRPSHCSPPTSSTPHCRNNAAFPRRPIVCEFIMRAPSARGSRKVNKPSCDRSLRRAPRRLWPSWVYLSPLRPHDIVSGRACSPPRTQANSSP